MVHNKEGSDTLPAPFYSGWSERHRASIEGKAGLEAAAVPASLESLLANRPKVLKLSDQEEAWVRTLVDRLSSRPESLEEEEFLVLHPAQSSVPLEEPALSPSHPAPVQTPPQSHTPLLLPDASPSAGDQLSEPPAH